MISTRKLSFRNLLYSFSFNLMIDVHQLLYITALLHFDRPKFLTAKTATMVYGGRVKNMKTMCELESINSYSTLE